MYKYSIANVKIRLTKPAILYTSPTKPVNYYNKDNDIMQTTQTNAQYNANCIHEMIINDEIACNALQAQLIAYMFKNRSEKYISWRKFDDLISGFATGYYSKKTMDELLRNEYKETRSYHIEKFNIMRSFYNSPALHAIYQMFLYGYTWKFAHIYDLLMQCHAEIIQTGKNAKITLADCMYILELQRVIKNRIIVISE